MATSAPALRGSSIDRFCEFSLLGLLGSGYLAVAGSGYLDLPTILVTAAGLALRTLMAAGLVRFHFSNRLIAAIAVAYVAFYPLDYLFISREFLPATVHLVFFLAVVKVLTATTSRDYFYVKIIAFLELLAASVLSSSLNFFVFLALFLLFGVATFASSEIRRSSESRHVVRAGMKSFARRLTLLTLVLSSGILAMTLGMFFLLPRTARAAFQQLVSDRYHAPGFSNEVTLGQTGEFKQEGATVMHVRLLNGEPATNLKWRGAALSEFDGRRWFNTVNTGEVLRVEKGLLPLATPRSRWRNGPRIGYEVEIRSLDADAIFFAGVPELLQIDLPLVIRTPTDSYRLGLGVIEGLHYTAYSLLEDPAIAGAAPDPLNNAEHTRYLSLPPLDPRIVSLARSYTSAASTDRDRAVAIETHLQRDYSYTTELPAAEPSDPLADFLFHRRKGHCEYFASAMAVMLRALKIPSRVVTGFQSGIFNPINGRQLIRASDAHSWVEAWLPDRGWTTFDPTPPDPDAAVMSLWTRVALYLDAADTFWQEWVLNYDFDHQASLAFRMEQSGRRFQLNWLDSFVASFTKYRDRVIVLARLYGRKTLLSLFALAILILAVSRLILWRRGRKQVERLRRGEAAATDATALYLRMLADLRRRGFEKPSWLTPVEFAKVLPPSAVGALVRDLTNAYNRLRFGGRKEAAPCMIALLDRLEHTR